MLVVRILHKLSLNCCSQRKFIHFSDLGSANLVIEIVCFIECAPAATVPSNCSKPKFDKIFVVGDSYVDTGNRDPCNTTYVATGRVNQNWATPYGRTHPGVPAGRFSDGKVLSDHLGTTVLSNPFPINRPFNI